MSPVIWESAEGNETIACARLGHAYAVEIGAGKQRIRHRLFTSRRVVVW